MKVVEVQNKINQLENIASKLRSCVEKMCDIDDNSSKDREDLLNQLDHKFGLTIGLIQQAAIECEIVVDKLQKQLNNCEVDMKY